MIESVAAFFAVWSIGFWILMVVSSVIFVLGCENDTIGWSLFLTVGLISYYWKSILLITNPSILLPIILTYLILGIMNSCWRLRQYARKMVEDYNKSGGSNGRDPKYELKLCYNKTRITNWIIFWPWNLLWNLVGDLFTSIYESMVGVYQKIIDNALKTVIVKKD